MKRLPSIPLKSTLSFQRCSIPRSYQKVQQYNTVLQHSSSAHTNTVVPQTVLNYMRCVRKFTTEPAKEATEKTAEATTAEATTDEAKNEEDEGEDVNEFFDDSAPDESTERGTKKATFVEFQDPNRDQRQESWKFIKKPNTGYTSNYKKIKAAYIGLPEAEMADVLPLPLNYRNKSGIATKQGKALPQFINDFKVPEPRYGINVENFLTKIGKDCGKYADKFKSWDELMTFKRRQLKKLEIPVKQRKWIRGWVEKYRRGIEPYSIRMKSIAKRNKEKKKEQVEAFKAIMKPKYEKTKAYRQKTEPLRLERKKLVRKIKQLTRTIRTAEKRMKDELAV